MGTDEQAESVQDVFNRLRLNGSWFWTGELAGVPLEETDLMSQLITTREDFIKLLDETDSDKLVEALVDSAGLLTPHLAIKHGMIATDASAELLDRAKDFLQFHNIGSLTIDLADGSKLVYDLQSLPTFKGKLSNAKIMTADEPLLRDLATLLTFGSVVREFEKYPSFRRLRLSTICGNPETVRNHFSELYLLVNRQTTGMKTAESGNSPQKLVKETLEEHFQNVPAVKRVSNSRVPGIGDLQFDLVFEVTTEDGPIHVAIEVAFQETTNSVIERKARLASALYGTFNKTGDYLCFVVDGAGYFARPKALKEIIANSHLCVTFKDEDLERLIEFILTLRNRK